MNIQDSIIFFMEILGTIAFAASGAMVGIRKRMDIFGICVRGDGCRRWYDQRRDPWEITFGTGETGICRCLGGYSTGYFYTALYQTGSFERQTGNLL